MTEDDIILAMARAHDAEAAAQADLQDPWKGQFADDPDWRQARFLAMREAFDVCVAMLAGAEA